jgi:hypothetical protein
LTVVKGWSVVGRDVPLLAIDGLVGSVLTRAVAEVLVSEIFFGRVLRGLSWEMIDERNRDGRQYFLLPTKIRRDKGETPSSTELNRPMNVGMIKVGRRVRSLRLNSLDNRVVLILRYFLTGIQRYIVSSLFLVFSKLFGIVYCFENSFLLLQLDSLKGVFLTTRVRTGYRITMAWRCLAQCARDDGSFGIHLNTGRRNRLVSRSHFTRSMRTGLNRFFRDYSGR